LACGEYGQEKIDRMVAGTDNGRSETWFQLPEEVKDSRTTGTNIQTLNIYGEIHLIYFHVITDGVSIGNWIY
jgi:hypothetical protein